MPVIAAGTIVVALRFEMFTQQTNIEMRDFEKRRQTRGKIILPPSARRSKMLG
jgi:hypothetical protein